MAVLPDWQVKGQVKLASATAKIPAAWKLSDDLLKDGGPTSTRNVLDVPRRSGILTERELELTEAYDATDLLQKLAAGQVGAEELTVAFCKRAAIAQQLTLCLTEVFFEEAIERAKYLDAYFEREGKPIGPLHGLPISVKDYYHIKGQYATLGIVSFISKPVADFNSAFAEILYNYGAVFYVKTNIPQTMMTADSENNVFGRCLNPHKLLLGAGGSSGGEGALIAQRGSVLGLGTDIGGSIRIPAFVNGIYGFKGTAGRIPVGGMQSMRRPGRWGIMSCAGPLGVSLRDLELIFRLTAAADPWTLDEDALAIPWRSLPPPTTTAKPLTIGVLTEDATHPLHPPMLRALRSATVALTAAGHRVVDLDTAGLPSLHGSLLLAVKFFMNDPASTAASHVTASGEPFIASIPALRMEELEGWSVDVDRVWEMHAEREEVRKAWRRVWVEQRLDAVVMAPYVGTAQAHDKYGAPPYTVLANLIDYPAAVLPYLKASKELDAPFDRSGQPGVKYRPAYNAEESEGMPCAIQVMGRPLQDEELMRHLEVVESALKASV
ncbi:MAG: hypothetical protein M1821_001901 [Bathelium mastoideum]|nr:MAG: hypothetical protein M1821_001901 [Bathelium mastoideum]